MQFEVRAVQEGQIVSIRLDAVSRADALRQVSARNLHPVALNALRSPAGNWLKRRAGAFSLPLFSQELLALLEAGLAIVEALETLAERERLGENRGIYEQLTERLREGKSFSDALESLPEVFSPLFIGMVRSSERTGDLPEALGRYIAYRTRFDTLRRQMISAAIYPSLLLIVGLIVTVFLGGYVVPRFAAVYQGAGRPLPWASQLLMDWGNLANTHATELIVAGIVLILILTVSLRSLSRHGGLRHLLLRIPFLAEHWRTYELSRLYLTLGMLLDSGLPILSAMNLIEESLPPALRQMIRKAAGQIRQGIRLSEAFEYSGLTTAVGLRMMRTGEASGRLGEMMARAARFHDDEVARWIERFSRAAEPVMMAAIGLVIGTIVVLLYLPIFDLAGSLH